MDCQVMYFLKLIKSVLRANPDCYIGDGVDWSYIGKLAKEHNLFPIFVEAASKYSSYILCPESRKEIEEALGAVAAQVRRTDAFWKLYDALVKADVYPLVLKGLICRQLYGELCDHRPSGRLPEYIYAYVQAAGCKGGTGRCGRSGDRLYRYDRYFHRKPSALRYLQERKSCKSHGLCRQLR